MYIYFPCFQVHLVCSNCLSGQPMWTWVLPQKKKNSVWPMIERQDSFSTLHTTLLIVAFQRRRHDTLTMIMKKCKRVIRSDLVKWWSLLITVTFLTEVINSNFRISICMVTSPINTERKKRVIMVFSFVCSNVYQPNCSDERLTLKTSAFILYTVANLRFQLSWYHYITLLYSPSEAVPQLPLFLNKERTGYPVVFTYIPHRLINDSLAFIHYVGMSVST